jgi:hypothetical protein
MGDYAKCECPKCGQHVEYPIEGSGAEISCPGCGVSITLPEAHSADYEQFQKEFNKAKQEYETRIAEIDRKADIIAANPDLDTCKTCHEIVAQSAEFCPHCGQKWPTLRLTCDNCGSKDIDLVTIEDNSSLFVTPSIAGAVASALFEAMRRKPKSYAVCQNCGASLELH